MALSRKGYEYGITPKGTHPFWDQTGEITGVNATVDVDDTTGTPSASVDNSYEEGIVTLDFHFSGLKGETGAKGDPGDPGPQGDGPIGATPVISATATADNTSSATPTVQVTKSGTDANPSFAFAFSGLKGQKGDTGDPGSQGIPGTNGVTPVITANATVDSNTGTPSVNVTKTGSDAAPTFNFAFSNIKGETGPAGQNGEPGQPGPAGQDGKSVGTTIYGSWTEGGQTITEKSGDLKFIQVYPDNNRRTRQSPTPARKPYHERYFRTAD